ncbi:MAG: MMPL family transporter [Ruminococcus sp.]|nr:MMPL family transporter [Ruminococcus sp.]
MKKITDYIVEKRNIFLILFIVLAGISLFLSTKVKINEDIMEYLPATSETKIGNDIMESEFSKQDSSTLNVMFKDLTNEEKINTLNKLKNIDGVDSVDYENDDDYNKDNYTLYVINVNDYSDSRLATEVYNYIIDNFDTAGMSGSIYDENKPILDISIVAIAIICAMIILIILSESYLEPFLYLISIGLAVFINKGTNIIFPSVSSITDSITAILQLALSMDYSIMLSNRFKQEKEKTNDKVKAMKNALYESFKSISSSSITTIVGLLALVFMSFTIGRDLGFVLSKGVLLSLICIFLCLPALLLLCDNLIAKTHKKMPHFNLTKLGIFSYKTRWFQTITVIILFALAYFLQGNTKILYTDSEQDEVGKIFPATNQIAIVYENKYEDLITSYCKKLEEDNKIDTVLCYSNTINEKLTYDELNPKFDSLGENTSVDEYLIKIIYYNYFNKDETSSLTMSDFISFIQNEIYPNENFKDSLSDEVRENIDLLANFATSSEINKKRNISEIMYDLDMDKTDAENILIYYNSKNINTKMTIKTFVDFMLNDVAKDPEYNSSLDDDTISKLEQLKKFTDNNTINKKMNAKELSNMFEIDEDLIEQLLLFHRIKSDSNTKITLNEFAKTALRLANDNEYEDMFDDDTIDSLNLLKTLSTDSVVSKELTSSEMGKNLASFGLKLNEEKINLLYTLYDGYNNPNIKMKINDFATLALNSASDTEKETLKTLKTLSDKQTIEKALDSKTMAYFLKDFGLDEATTELLYQVYGGSKASLNVNEFASNALTLSTNPLFSNYFDEITKASLNKIIELNKIKNVKMNNDDLYNIFSIDVTDETIKNALDEKLGTELKTPLEFATKLDLTEALLLMSDKEYSVSEFPKSITNNKLDTLTISAIYGVTNKEEEISVKDLIKFIYDNQDNSLIASSLGDNKDGLNLLYTITSNADNFYTASELSNMLNQDKLKVSFIYGTANATNLNKIDKISIKDLIAFLYQNKDSSLLADSLGNNNDSLELAYMVTSNIKTRYNYKDVSKITGTEKDQVRQIYGLYDYLNYDTLISPLELTNLILDNINDELLKDKINNDDLELLDLVKKVMINSLNNTKLTHTYIGDLLDIDNDTISLLYSLYDFKYIKANQKVSFYNYINFIINEVMDDKDYADKFNQETREKLITINSIMSKALNNEKYNSLELYGTLNVLSDNLDKSLIELVYLYNSSINEYDSLWSITVEEFINYLNEDILNDTRFEDFIDEEMHNTIKDAKDTIDKAKKLIVSDEYSRVVLNTKYSFESEETFNFINTLNNDLGKIDGIYVVGNSPMAVEMSGTFNDELNRITILTMIFIFVVVAITFKDLLIPLILVLIIQCAVYITMSYISLSGGSVYFISLLIVQAILMGATIDYAIVYTSYYKESRLTMNVKDAIINAYNKSIHTIINSSSILIIVTMIVANFASAIAAKICETISQGALASAILILLILPGVLASVDRIICRNSYKKN